MDKFIPNLTIVQTPTETLAEWARRLTSNNLILMQTIDDLENKLAELSTRLETIEAQIGGNNE